MPKELKAVLNDFLNHKVDFSKTNNIPDKISSDKKTSVLEGIHEAEKEIKEKGNGKSDVKKKETER